MFSKRTMFVALMGLLGASAAKTSSFSVCTDAYSYGNSGSATLYSCNGANDPDLTDPVGSVTFDCGEAGDENSNQDGNYYCDTLFAINDCLIGNVAAWNEDADAPTDIQMWSASGKKGCPKSTAYGLLEYSQVESGLSTDLFFETYTFNYLKPQFRAPLDSTKTKTTSGKVKTGHTKN